MGKFPQIPTGSLDQQIVWKRERKFKVSNSFQAMTSMISNQPYIPTKAAFNLLANQVASTALMNMDVHSHLWGYDEPLIRLGNKWLPGWITFSKMGILDRVSVSKVLFSRPWMPPWWIWTSTLHGHLWDYDEPLKNVGNTWHWAWITFSKMGIVYRVRFSSKVAIK